MKCTICEQPSADTLLLEAKFWTVSIADDQAHLGRSFVTQKRHCGDLAELNAEEWSELHEVIKQFETALRKSFDATLFNWSCLMNHAFREKPYNPHVHWHVRPRYEKDVEFAGEKFTDEEFGNHYARNTDRSVTPIVRKQILELIKSNF